VSLLATLIFSSVFTMGMSKGIPHLNLNYRTQRSFFGIIGKSIGKLFGFV
jgi:hypothetical protein